MFRAEGAARASIGDPGQPRSGHSYCGRSSEVGCEQAVRLEGHTNQGRNGKPNGSANGRNGAVDEATLRELLAALRAASGGDFDFRLSEGQGGLGGELARAYNDLAERRSNLADELQRVARVVTATAASTSAWRCRATAARGRETIDAVNGMIDDLVRPTTEIARVIDAVADGDLSQKMELQIDGTAGARRVPPHRHDRQRDGRPALRFADEVTRVAREVGTEGKLGGQAKVKGDVGRLEGPHRQRQPDGVEPDRTGARHRRGHEGGRRQAI